MNSAVNGLIESLVEEIRVRQDAVKALHALDPNQEGLTTKKPETGMGLMGEGPARSVKVKVRVNGKRPAAAGVLSRRAGPEVIEAVAGLAEPFGTQQFEDAVGVNKKTATNYLQRWLHKLWVTRVGFGQYKRTAHFPVKAHAPVAPTGTVALASSAAAVPAPNDGRRGGVDKAYLERQVQEVCRDRDRARSAGQAGDDLSIKGG
jgi:hypothetical protein